MNVMHWISVDDDLPKDGQAVIVRYNEDNCRIKHTLSDGSESINWRWETAIFRKGRTSNEIKLYGIIRFFDEDGNNLVPYGWELVGPGNLFGQEVSHWAAICDPL